MFDRKTGMAVLALVMVVTGLAWMLYEMGNPGSSLRVLDAETPSETLLFTSGRSIFAYHLFLILVALIPPLYFAAALWLSPDTSERPYVGSVLPIRRYWRPLYLALFYMGLCSASLLTGYGYETLQTEIRLNPKYLWYQAGQEVGRIAWSDVKIMALRFGPRSQQIEMQGQEATLKIDLSAYSLPDRKLLVERLPEQARLHYLSRHAGQLVWRRTPLETVPEP